MPDAPTLPGSFARDGELLHPSRFTESGWTPDTLMGRYLAGLVAWAAEQHSEPDLQPSRLTVDMFRPAPMGPTMLRTTVVRSGRRIRVVDVDVVVAGVVVCRGSVVFLRRSYMPDSSPWYPAEWSPPVPETLQTMAAVGWEAPWDQRLMGTWGDPHSSRGIWLRETHPFVAGEPLSPFVRVALAVDNANGGINVGPRGLPYINADLTLTLAALPEGDWIGLDPISRAVGEGISVGSVDVYDLRRRIGQVAMIGLVDERTLRPQ
ncbi:MAG: thioesterase family protein [Actinomycetota bacterium]|nr:thioesterase family protein [Actinomycetota bacterium]